MLERLFGARPGGQDVLPLLFAELGLEQQVRHAHNARERGPDLVVDPGEELGFEAAEFLRLLRPRRGGLVSDEHARMNESAGWGAGFSRTMG